MSLSQISFRLNYRSNRNDLMKDFYLPTLSKSSQYIRGAGFFSIELLNNIGKGIYPFIANGGVMKLVCGVELTEGAVNEISNGYLLKQEIDKTLDSKIEFPKTSEAFLSTELSNICWMIAHDRLDIKIAIRVEENKIQNGIYHEKIAVFTDKDDNKIATIGSANETCSAYNNNFESFDVFTSWSSEENRERIQIKASDFYQLWEDNTEGLFVCEFPLAAKQKLIRLAPDHPIDDQYKYIPGNIPSELVAKSFGPLPYQKEAIEKWKQNGYKGILAMATGTGKTFTALFGLQLFLDENQGNYLSIICCPYQHLVDQWEKNIKIVFPNTPIIKCFLSNELWHGPLKDMLPQIVLGNYRHVIVVTTTATGSSDEFINLVNVKKIKKIVICDEVHNIGSSKNRKFLFINSIACLGLSATPIRRYDEEGNAAIIEYFGEPVYKLGLKKAIKMGFLVEYDYHIYFAELNEAEYEQYKNVSIDIARIYSDNQGSYEDRLQKLLLKRARILSSCNDKLNVLNKILLDIKDYSNMLVYTAEDPEYFNQTLQILTNNKIKTLKITAKISNKKREKAIYMHSQKDIDCILAMRCLDEGVDIPSANKAIILASSTNEKQYIQRRGRVLRLDNKGEKRKADIYDVIVLPPEFTSDMDKGLFERELSRTLDFALIARNGLQKIEELQEFCCQNKLMNSFVNVFSNRDEVE